MCKSCVLLCVGFSSSLLCVGIYNNEVLALTIVGICNFGQSFSTRKYKKTHLHHYRSPRKKLKTQEEMSDPPTKDIIIIIKLETQK
jgi:hypothetical protein